MLKKYISLSNLTLFVALALSTIAACYSIIGLTAIYAGAFIPVVIMGSVLEVGKITAIVWLRSYWTKCSWVLKLYLVPAVVALALLTSMGIFGFLSKAHMDQGLTSGDVLAKISIYDEKIKTAKENIDANHKALKQMDEAVDQVMGRSTDEKGAEKAVAIRRGQAKERVRLQSEIALEQKAIASLNSERAPIAAEVRKVEAEVGPIKYIAALIYGDNPDSNLLERAVRWVTILLVLVFDPLAIALVLAANQSKEWDTVEKVDEEFVPLKLKWPFLIKDRTYIVEPQIPEDKPIVVKKVFDTASLAVTEEEEDLFKNIEQKTQIKTEPSIEDQIADTVDPDPVEEVIVAAIEPEIVTEITPVIIPEIKKGTTLKLLDGGYVEYDGKLMHNRVLREAHPELFIAEDPLHQINTGFGTEFPLQPSTSDMFVRTDFIPNVVYKYNGARWIEVNRQFTDSYLTNDAYIEFLISKIATGEYDPDLLSDAEQDAVQKYVTGKNA